MSKKGTVYFFTGLAGAGKTTIGGLFYQRLKEKKADAILIDGDPYMGWAQHRGWEDSAGRPLYHGSPESGGVCMFSGLQILR